MTSTNHSPRRRGWLGPALLAATALLTSGCLRVAFTVANRGQPPADATAAYAPGARHGIDIYRPVAANGPAPVVVFFYGGSWQTGDRADYRFVGRRLASQGLLVLVADYRTYPATTFPGFVEDGASAVAWARAHAADWGGDPRCLFVAGHSAGAQIAALLATDRRYLEAHGMKPTDLAGTIALSGPHDFAITGDLVPIFGDRAEWPRAQPVNFIDGDEPAFLLVHGLRDTVVEAQDSRELAARLERAKVPATLQLLPEGTHSTPLVGVYDPKRVPGVLPAITRFVAACRPVEPG
ncbi:alpha/beta hydrolase [Thermomonas carbonis]|uniref:Alpha/beta hydrolase n=1 Tax=Thermomonas carbonis TaxID=1463158 RepID=A0A7G9STW0_9GAMM|nr:alpha/beta hydrolase [Thermomonas carbonis]QNN71285.1 alpha/beta hydrolase [Thermomonas carbonis]GHC10638.1 carboxylesterase [Thermomonas carbonis]